MSMTGIQFSPPQTARESLSSKKEHFEQLLGRCEGERMSQAEGMARAKAQLWEGAGLEKDIYRLRACREEEWGCIAYWGQSFSMGDDKYWN